MNFRLMERIALSDGSLRYNISISGAELIFLGYILESFEGWCNYTTRKDNDNLLQIDVPADYRNSVEELLEYLHDWNY